MHAKAEDSKRRSSRRSFAPFSGVLVPALTPFKADLAVDRESFFDFLPEDAFGDRYARARVAITKRSQQPSARLKPGAKLRTRLRKATDCVSSSGAGFSCAPKSRAAITS